MDFGELERQFRAHRNLGQRPDDGIFVTAGEAMGVPLVRKEVHSRDPWTVRRELVMMRLLEYAGVGGVVRVVAARTRGDRTVIYMPYWEDGDLLESLETEPHRWPMPARVRLWQQLLRTLERVHAAGVAHRDIKAENILVRWGRAGPEPCLADFGLSTHLTRRRCSNSGTLTYAAPEILDRTRFDLVATDVWAMGVLLYLLLYSDMPFSPRGSRCSTVGEVQARIRVGHYVHPEGSRVPPGLRALVDQMLAREPADRPSPADLLASEALRAVLAAPQLLPPIQTPHLGYQAVAYRSSEGYVSPDEYDACLAIEDQRARHVPPLPRLVTPPGH